LWNDLSSLPQPIGGGKYDDLDNSNKNTNLGSRLNTQENESNEEKNKKNIKTAIFHISRSISANKKNQPRSLSETELKDLEAQSAFQFAKEKLHRSPQR